MLQIRTIGPTAVACRSVGVGGSYSTLLLRQINKGGRRWTVAEPGFQSWVFPYPIKKNKLNSRKNSQYVNTSNQRNKGIG